MMNKRLFDALELYDTMKKYGYHPETVVTDNLAGQTFHRVDEHGAHYIVLNDDKIDIPDQRKAPASIEDPVVYLRYDDVDNLVLRNSFSFETVIHFFAIHGDENVL